MDDNDKQVMKAHLLKFRCPDCKKADFEWDRPMFHCLGCGCRWVQALK